MVADVYNSAGSRETTVPSRLDRIEQTFQEEKNTKNETYPSGCSHGVRPIDELSDQHSGGNDVNEA